MKRSWGFLIAKQYNYQFKISMQQLSNELIGITRRDPNLRQNEFGRRTWAEEKQNQLACRLNWLSFELVKKLLQQEGYVLLYGTFEWPIMIKWTQNPKYYLDTEENRNSRHFVRKDMLGPHDIKSIESHSRLTSDWWYKHKA
ncbi:hypothetical protein GLOIN_2v1763763 [Rhizophagus irregularis DAOM 181602=DAOM 197198]|nr:hypothetical protein GLOIN_2v1763763 [Rhizophagus irregularis DAOM 181602=DAOM 197198]